MMACPMTFKPGPRIYNLFPRLLGPIATWIAELPRIRAMGFDWVYLNPYHYPGFSGSLYAVKDYDRVNELFLNPDDPRDGLAQLREFLDAAHGEGLRVMMDLVINHTAFDSVLAGAHPEWFKRDAEGKLVPPGCWEGPQWITWGDLAQLDHLGTPDRDGLWRYLRDLLLRQLDLGFDGFRCDAAYHVPYPLWRYLIPEVKARQREARFFGETLGCPAVDVIRVAEAGFDYVFNSARWWNMHSDWFLRDFRRTLGCAPSIAFPESHDTPRYAHEASGIEAASRQKYLVCALVSAGVMMPFGFEFGYRQPTDVVHTQPEDREEPIFDLSGFVTEVNALKARHRMFNEDGDLYDIPSWNPMTMGLVKSTADKREKALLVINADLQQWQEVHMDNLADQVGCEGFEDLSFGHRMAAVPEKGPFIYNLAPCEVRILRAKI